jgi:uncharacterized tellurite resistance protein B-like protein
LAGWKSDVTKIAAALAVSLISSDGVIEEEEKAVAVEAGRRILPGFSKAIFDALLEEIDELPSAYELAAPLRKKLDDESKDMIIEYLVAVATADQEVVQVEVQELKAVAQALGVPLPPLRVSQPDMDD